MKKIFFLVLMLVTVVGCNLISSSDSFEQPQGKVIVDNKDYTMTIGSFKWKEDDFEARKISSSDIKSLANEFETLDVKEGEKLKIQIEQNPSSITVNQKNEDGTSKSVGIQDNQIILPSEKGYYIYEITAKWNKGEIKGRLNYIFDVKIN